MSRVGALAVSSIVSSSTAGAPCKLGRLGVSDTTTPIVLTASDGNTTRYINKADTIAYTLPALSTVEPGTSYRFKLSIVITADSTITAAGSDIIAGNISTAADGAATAGAATGTVITFDESAGDTLGDWVELEAGPAAVWFLTGGCTVALAITLA